MGGIEQGGDQEEGPAAAAASVKRDLKNIEVAEARLEDVRRLSPVPTKYGTFTNPFTGTGIKSHDWILLSTPIGKLC